MLLIRCVICKIERAWPRRRRVWRFIRASRQPWVIGLELAIVAALWSVNAIHPGYTVASGLVGAAFAVHFADDLDRPE